MYVIPYTTAYSLQSAMYCQLPTVTAYPPNSSEPANILFTPYLVIKCIHRKIIQNTDLRVLINGALKRINYS